ncbi:MAG: secondary thiamine-phosphate synthase enzyme YjbQ [Lentilitoribacter sp.]
MQKAVHMHTQGSGLYEFTHEAVDFVQSAGVESGLLTLFVRHTSCSLLIQENADPDVRFDLDSFFKRLVPRTDHPSMSWVRHTMEGPDDMPAHIKAAMMPVSLTIPVANHRPVLGTWQGIYLFEHRDHPHDRQIVLHLSD